MNINRRNFILGSAAAATLAGCATNKVGLRALKPGETYSSTTEFRFSAK